MVDLARWAGLLPRWRRSDWSYSPRASIDRLGSSLPAIGQIVIAVIASYSIALYAVGHVVPVVAVTVTISILGFGRDARPLRVIETALGITLGIALSEAIILSFGQGVVQLAVAVGLTLIAARIVSPSPSFAVIAGVQSVLVAVLPAAAGGPFTRTIDGLIGGAVALAVTALVPRDPRKLALRDGRNFLTQFAGLLEALVGVLRVGHRTETDRVLEAARRTQPLVEAWSTSLDSAVAIARISPFLRNHLAELERQQVMQRNLDLAIRNLRVLTRRLAVLDRDGRARPELADVLSSMISGVNLLAQSLVAPEIMPVVRQNLILIAVQLHPDILLPGQSVAEATVVFALRPMMMDLLCAAGLSADDARAAMPSMGE